MPNDSPSKNAVEAVIDALSQGMRERNAEAIDALFAPHARIFDLAPPLAHGLDRESLAEWLAGWDGPVEQSISELAVEVSGDLAVCHGLAHIQTRRDGADVSWWMRATYVLARVGNDWRIRHEHTSVPFHMDGSYRAAIDLQP